MSALRSDPHRNSRVFSRTIQATMDSSQNYKFSTQAQLDYQVKYEEELKRKGIRCEGAKFQQLRKNLGENLPVLLKKEQKMDKKLDKIKSFNLDERL